MLPTVVFVHAHPDDESIFTGGTMVRLARAGWRVVLVVATGGELGEPSPGALGSNAVAALRRAETERAAGLLGVAAVDFLGYRDSGMAGAPSNLLPGSLWSARPSTVGDRLATVLRREGAVAVVGYDEAGIYGHPDHVRVHEATRLAAAAADVDTLYEATIDREYLHFVETHLVEEAALAGDLGLVRSHLGVSTVMVSATVDVRSCLELKRAAMAAHASQIPETTSALQLGLDHFGAVYGWEWYVRHGPPGPIDELSR